jgi:signal transduction histidine kinase
MIERAILASPRHRPYPHRWRTPRRAEQASFPSGREAVLLAIALLSSAWLVALADGASATALTVRRAPRLHVVFLVGRERELDSQGACAPSGGGDVTELRAASVAADAANKRKSEFLANMSHEIRTADERGSSGWRSSCSRPT